MSVTLHSFPKISFSFIRQLRFSGLLLLLLMNASISQAQVNGYTFTSTTGNTLESGGFTNLMGTFLDDDVSATTNIGFTFRYAGTDYTNFSVTSNGLLRLGGSAITDYNNVTGNLTGAYLVPYWDDNYTDADGNVQYKLMGAPGSRKLVVEYNLSYLGNTGAADKRFQVWLFETSNRVQFVYGNGNNFNGGFSVGVLTNGLTDFVSVTVATHTASIVTAQDNNTTWPGSGRSYSFAVGSTLPVSLLNFSGYKDGNRNQLQWTTVTEINNRGFELQRSADGNSFTTIGFVHSLAAGGNSNSPVNYQYTDNTASGNKYYYRLRQVDLDDRSKLSAVIVIDGRKATAVQLEAVFPNPASNMLNLQITSPNKQPLTISLHDMAGKIILQKILPVGAGNNTIPVDISRLVTNFYLLKIADRNGNNCGSMKVTVIK